MIQCPFCKKSDNRVLLQLHWSKKYHTFICGHCKWEFDLKILKDFPINPQLKWAFMGVLQDECGDKMNEIMERVKNMTIEERLARLKELEDKEKKK